MSADYYAGAALELGREVVKHFPFGNEISEALSFAGVVVKMVAKLVSTMKGNDHTCSRISSAVQDLKLN